MIQKSNIEEIANKYNVTYDKVIEVIENLEIIISRKHRSIVKDKIKEVEEALELELNPCFKCEKDNKIIKSENSDLLSKLSKLEDKVSKLQFQLSFIEQDKKETSKIIDEIGEMFFNDRK